MTTENMRPIDAAGGHRAQEQARWWRLRLPVRPGGGYVGTELAARQEESAETERAISDVGEFLQTLNRHLSFCGDDKSGRTIVSVDDQSTGDVTRQIPSEVSLRISEKIEDLQKDVGSAVRILANNTI